jgi:CxxC-x17-CxxC domain-containing protein
MAASILHFGQELCNRFPVLRNNGYSVHRYENIPDFRQALQSGMEYDAVSMPEIEEDVSGFVVQAARCYSPAPLILFRTGVPVTFQDGDEELPRTQANLDADFDLIVPAAAPPLRWMADIGALIARSRALKRSAERICERAVLLKRQTAEVIERTRLEFERCALECARNARGDAAPQTLADRDLKCTDCGAEFVFTAGEQYFFHLRNFVNDPKLCKSCRSMRRSGVPRPRPKTKVICPQCGLSATVSFKPTEGRPVLCHACFHKYRLMA